MCLQSDFPVERLAIEGGTGEEQVEMRLKGRHGSYQWQRLPLCQVHRVGDRI